MRDAGKAIFYLSYPKNSISSGVPPRIPLGELTTLPRPPSRVGRAPLPTPLLLGTFGASLPGRRLQRLFNILKRTLLYKILDPPLPISGSLLLDVAVPTMISSFYINLSTNFLTSLSKICFLLLPITLILFFDVTIIN